VHFYYVPMSGWCLCHMDDACNAYRWPNLLFYHIVGKVIVSFFSWCDAWKWTISSLLLIVISFLFSLLLKKVHVCPFCFLYFNFSPHSFYFLFLFFFFFYKSFVCFQFSFSIKIYYLLFFSVRSLFFLFLIFFPWPFC
jgi:hypothetical protein